VITGVPTTTSHRLTGVITAWWIRIQIEGGHNNLFERLLPTYIIGEKFCSQKIRVGASNTLMSYVLGDSPLVSTGSFDEI
jgi:hypothetical protein